MGDERGIERRLYRVIFAYVAILMAFNPILPSLRRAYDALWPGTFATALWTAAAVWTGALLVWLWGQGRLRDARSWGWVALLMGAVGGVATTFQDPIEFIHLPEYGALAILWCRVLGSGPGGLLRAGLAAAAVGILDEAFQAVLPQRVYDTRDVVYNAVGALLGVVAYGTVWNSRASRKM